VAGRARNLEDFLSTPQTLLIPARDDSGVVNIFLDWPILRDNSQRRSREEGGDRSTNRTQWLNV
jgi:hypothetical protein